MAGDPRAMLSLEEELRAADGPARDGHDPESNDSDVEELVDYEAMAAAGLGSHFCFTPHANGLGANR